MDTYEHIITHLRLISARKQPCDDAFVKQALEHPDPIVRQWAISAASRVKDREFIFEKLQQILNSDVYYDVRIYALFYLTKMHYKISRILVDDFLSQAVTSKQKAIIYEVLRMLQVLRTHTKTNVLF